MSRSKNFPTEIYELVKSFYESCPICSMDIPNGGKKKITKSSMRLQRTSNSSFTLICRICKLKQTITWKSLAEAIGNRADAVSDNDEYEEEYAFYANAFDLLEKNVNIGGIVRDKLEKKQLKQILRNTLH